MGIQHYNQVSVAPLTDAYGAVTYIGDTVTWNLPSSIGRPDVTVNGFVLDPTGDYIIQQAAYVQVDADETQWTTSGGTFTHGTNESTGKLTLKQTNGSPSVAFSATWAPTSSEPRGDDLGLFMEVYRGAPISSTQLKAADFNFYIEFNNGFAPGEYGLRLAIEAGQAIRLEQTQDGATWVTVDTAYDLGESESYLRSKNRYFTIDVVPMTDRTWWDGLPQSSFTSGPPADFVAVSINNGDAVLIWRKQRALFPAGAVKITGKGGDWGVDYFQRWYYPAAAMTLPEQTRFKPFQGVPRTIFSGYLPYKEGAQLNATLTDINKVVSTLVVQSPPQNIDNTTGYSLDTVMLVSAAADWPHIETPPNGYLPVASFQCVSFEENHWFDQTNFLRRSAARITILDNTGAGAPGWGVVPSVRAAALTRGNQHYVESIHTITANDISTGITGLVDGEITWEWREGQKYISFTIKDKFRDDILMLYDLPYDGQCHYYAIRRLAYKMGISDRFMQNFPTCGRNSDCPHYHLPQGTVSEPILAFLPNMTVLEAMLEIRKLSGELDFTTGQVLPMYLYFDADGNLQYLPAPVGIVQTWLNPNLTIGVQSVYAAKYFKVRPTFNPGGEPNLDEFYGTLSSTADTRNIRNQIILIGESPADGSLNLGYYYNPALGGGIYGNPYAFGNVGIDKAYINISKLYTTQEAVQRSLAVAAVQMSFPSIGTAFKAWLQPNIFPLMVVGVQDFGTQGTIYPVAYYVTQMTNTFQQSGNQRIAYSDIKCRLLGQAA